MTARVESRAVQLGNVAYMRQLVQHCRPVRLNFVRRESDSCGEMVLFPDFNRSADLTEGETVPIEFTPETVGEFGFQCQMGMFRGRLIVEQ